MTHMRELNVMPSVTVGEDGKETGWKQLAESEKERKREHIRREIEDRLSAYYSAHPEEWEIFAGKVLRENG